MKLMRYFYTHSRRTIYWFMTSCFLYKITIHMGAGFAAAPDFGFIGGGGDARRAEED
jgi:hypothetical protein